jgi:hypothetical protein
MARAWPSAGAAPEMRGSELIVLFDDRCKIRKTKHHNERDQKADCAELHYRNQIGIIERRKWPRPFRCRFFSTQLGRHWWSPAIQRPLKGTCKRISGL